MSSQESKHSAASGSGTPEVATSVPVKGTTKSGKGQGQHKKGKGSKDKRNEEFTRRKNQEFQAKLDAEDEAWHQSFKTTVDLFGQRPEPSVVTPMASVEVATDTAVDIVVKTVDVLYTACKIPPKQGSVNPRIDDIHTLLLATAFQLDAKFYNASMNTKFSIPAHWAKYQDITRVTDLLDRALLPIAYMVDQIGKISVMGQSIIPRACDLASLSIDSLTTPNPNNRIFTRPEVRQLFQQPELPPHSFPVGDHALRDGRMLPVYFVVENMQLAYDIQLIVMADARQVILNQQIYRGLAWDDRRRYGHEILFDGRAEVPNITEVHQRYTELCGRIEKKLSQNAFSSLGLREARGTAAQIVGVHYDDDSPHDKIATCLRAVQNSDYCVSAYLDLGYETQHPFHDEDVALQRVRVDTTGAIENLVSVLTKRLR